MVVGEGDAREVEILTKEEALVQHHSEVIELSKKFYQLFLDGDISEGQLSVIGEIWDMITEDRYTTQMLEVTGPEDYVKAVINLEPIQEQDERRARMIGAIPEEMKDEFFRCAINAIRGVEVADRSSLHLTGEV